MTSYGNKYTSSQYNDVIYRTNQYEKLTQQGNIKIP